MPRVLHGAESFHEETDTLDGGEGGRKLDRKKKVRLSFQG